MYGISTYIYITFTIIYHKNQANVGKYTIHGWYGIWNNTNQGNTTQLVFAESLVIQQKSIEVPGLLGENQKNTHPWRIWVIYPYSALLGLLFQRPLEEAQVEGSCEDVVVGVGYSCCMF